MKLSRTTIEIVMAVGVLLLALVVGLVIRQARQPASPSPTPSRIARNAAGLTAEEAAKQQAARAEKLKQNEKATPEQKEQFKKDLAQQLTSRAPRDANAVRDQGLTVEQKKDLQRIQSRIKRAAGTTPDANSSGASTQDANRPR